MAFIYNGGAAPENHVKALITTAFQIDFNTPSGTYAVPVPAGYMVDDILTVVSQVCDGSPTLKIGDGDDDDGYLTSAVIALSMSIGARLGLRCRTRFSAREVSGSVAASSTSQLRMRLSHGRLRGFGVRLRVVTRHGWACLRSYGLKTSS